MPSFIGSFPKYHGMNRYRFPRYLPLLSEKYSILKTLQRLAACQRIREHSTNAAFDLSQF